MLFNFAGKNVVKALYDYHAPVDDANASSDLNLRVNDVLVVINESVKFKHVFFTFVKANYSLIYFLYQRHTSGLGIYTARGDIPAVEF